MIAISGWHRIINRTLFPIVAGAALVGISESTPAFVLNDPTTCSPGQKWDVSRPVTVRILGDSVFDYLTGCGVTPRALSISTGSTATSKP